MGSPIADDDNLLLVTLVVTVVFQLAFFFVAFACKFDKVSFSHCCAQGLRALVSFAQEGRAALRQWPSLTAPSVSNF